MNAVAQLKEQLMAEGIKVECERTFLLDENAEVVEEWKEGQAGVGAMPTMQIVLSIKEFEI
jgi:hypothetical protein